jgi:hypothetical protein
MQKKNFQITTFETVAPFHRVKTSVNDYVIIPVHVVTQIGIQCTDTTSFQLAIKPHGAKKWEYLNGTTITPELKSRFFPDLKDVAFPPVKNKLLR